ncbi:MAG: Phosphoribosylformylglycinamidine synthase, PurS subunit, partial [uncultured Nocardioides sp.]
GSLRRRRHAQARDPRPAGQGGARRPAPPRLHRRGGRAAGQALRARGRGRGHSRAARRGRADRRDAAREPRDRGLRGPHRGAHRGRGRPGGGSL